ncbi:putative ABC transporter permease YvcS [Bacillus sp. J14TS2]|uniref:FtsX-like permease family protein n=1 Tax=Bacillus sp. J14TS2 TaxID=2807188 RepID=UPI001B1C3D29|nr:FtsX-like permease family protein [Bacillus sp. J14TS2]GIN74742.1 putative ABC transporter permease YvcS [Bacillus sp. J14TS2]
MTFRQLLYKNLRRNLQSYASFILSNIFTVFIFYLFLAFVLHPNLANQDIHPIIYVLFISCNIAIIFFTIFFTVYSYTAMMKSRKKEFGLLKMVGLTNKKIARLVFVEFTAISFLSIIIGILTGILLSRLFFMFVNVILQQGEPLLFSVPPLAIIITLCLFLFLFEGVTLIGLREIHKSEIIHLINAVKLPKESPIYSPKLTFLSVVLLLVGYLIAAFSNLFILFFSMIPILLLVITGTYLLFMQGTTVILQRLRNSPLFWKNINMTTISALIFKMKDNARILSVAAVLSAIAMSSMGLLFWFTQYSDVGIRGPQDLMVIQKDVETQDGSLFSEEKIRALAEKHQVTIKAYEQTVVLPTSILINQQEKTAWIISDQDYNRRIKPIQRSAQAVDAEAGKTVFISPFEPFEGKEWGATKFTGNQVEMKFANQDPLQLELQANLFAVTIIRGGGYQPPYLLVVDQSLFTDLQASMDRNEQLVLHDYYFTNLAHAPDLLKDIQSNRTANDSVMLLDGFSDYLEINKWSTLLLMIGHFIACLFFLTTSSLIYFKLYTEMEEERKSYTALKKLGFTQVEMRKMASIQIAILFFLPVLVGSLHTVFVYVSASLTLGAEGIWKEGFIAIAVYYLFQAIYYAITRQIYLKRVIS